MVQISTRARVWQGRHAPLLASGHRVRRTDCAVTNPSCYEPRLRTTIAATTTVVERIGCAVDVVVGADIAGACDSSTTTHTSVFITLDILILRMSFI